MATAAGISRISPATVTATRGCESERGERERETSEREWVGSVGLTEPNRFGLVLTVWSDQWGQGHFGHFTFKPKNEIFVSSQFRNPKNKRKIPLGSEKCD
jgi:hypothetical protein